LLVVFNDYRSVTDIAATSTVITATAVTTATRGCWHRVQGVDESP